MPPQTSTVYKFTPQRARLQLQSHVWITPCWVPPAVAEQFPLVRTDAHASNVPLGSPVPAPATPGFMRIVSSHTLLPESPVSSMRQYVEQSPFSAVRRVSLRTGGSRTSLWNLGLTTSRQSL
jgi:hypothetical protein